MKVKCPACGRPSEFAPTNPHRPFCSARCQAVDLGAWAEERYRMPTSESDATSVNEISDETPSRIEPRAPKHRPD